MKKRYHSLAFLAFAMLPFIAQNAHAERSLCQYHAYISDNDKYNSRGDVLDLGNETATVAAILQQDRANLYNHISDEADDLNYDESDCFFSTKNARMRIPAMLDNGYISQDTIDAIIDGHPLVTVTVFPSGIHVEMAE